MYNGLRRCRGLYQGTDAHDRHVATEFHVGTAVDYLCRHERESAITTRGSQEQRAALAARLLSRVADPRNLYLALVHLARKGGQAPGPDGIRPRDLGPAAQWALARALRQIILSDKYRPGP